MAISRGRWPAVLLLGAGARIVLDPGVHGYYTPGILLGAVLWDLLGSRRPVPMWTIVSFCALNLVPLATANDEVRGDFRLCLVVAFTLVILAGPDRWVWRPDSIRPRQSRVSLLRRNRVAAPPDPERAQDAESQRGSVRIIHGPSRPRSATSH